MTPTYDRPEPPYAVQPVPVRGCSPGHAETRAGQPQTGVVLRFAGVIRGIG